jgi:hypothetical protein
LVEGITAVQVFGESRASSAKVRWKDRYGCESYCDWPGDGTRPAAADRIHRVLPSKRGVRKGAAFLFGWLVSLAIVITVTVLATGNNPPKPNTAPSLASDSHFD